MLFSECYNKQCIHKNWQSYTQINWGTICAKDLPFRVQPFRGVNCGLIPYYKGKLALYDDLNQFCGAICMFSRFVSNMSVYRIIWKPMRYVQN